MKTVRQEIIEEVSGNFEKAGFTVFIGEKDIKISDLPFVIITPGQDSVRSAMYNRDSLSMTLILTGLREWGADASWIVSEIILAEIRAVMGEEITAESVSYISGGTEDYPEYREGEYAVQVTAEFTIDYITQKNNPYER